VLVKGGHRSVGGQALDILLDENGIFTEFQTDYIEIGDVHGSGCTLSAAIAASSGKGLSLEESVASAKKYVTDAIRALQHAPRIVTAPYQYRVCFTRS
jgi:hydroxymethylpyrimidine/phosphomethylpyrimidine kinase